MADNNRSLTLTTRFPRVRVERNYRFRAWHRLKSANNALARDNHWHNYTATVILYHEVNPNGNGWAFDFDDLDCKLSKIFEALEGVLLNDIMSVEPTSEMLACFLLAKMPPYVDGIRVSETANSSAEVMRKDIPQEWLNRFTDTPPSSDDAPQQ